MRAHQKDHVHGQATGEFIVGLTNLAGRDFYMMNVRTRLIPLFHFAFVHLLFIGRKSVWAVAATKENSDLIHKRSVPIASCPRETYPLILHGKVKECQPGKTNSCPEGFLCYFDNVDGRYICCGKSTGYCEGGKPYLDPHTNEPQRCKSTAPNTCRKPYSCIPKDGSDNGYCCLDLSNIEPPPIGCPWGTRPLRDTNKQLIQCVPGVVNACPGGTICYFDSLERTNRCCGRDPGEGCPTGTRALKVNNHVVPCLPGDPQQKCPDKAICQWSYLIDRFQCCEADDGCPLDSTPYFEPGGGHAIRACRPFDQSTTLPPQNSCPNDYNCEFNFWTTSYQCCGKKSERSIRWHPNKTEDEDDEELVDNDQLRFSDLTEKERAQMLHFCKTVWFYWACSSMLY